MEEKFKATLRALITGTKSYKLTWGYLSDRYFDEVEAYYDRTNETEAGTMYMAFDSAFEAVYGDLLMFIVCADVTDEDDESVGELFELRMYQVDGEQDIDLESAVLLYDSIDEQYEGDLKHLYALAAGSASGVDRLMDQLIRELGEA
ncbi:hypothetical protein [Caryophanon latum]|uniref:Uncharacterized protein n=1 Tax=Caryophanon latum TaxID=33977 RepID=A0A1C0YUJ6_9BACL|nr:hypothetical protein [Caryophanon latum]OCS90829.1 hypothetical protein A6K76_01905 [Caryophanon latum]